jgi:hypothetical protein
MCYVDDPERVRQQARMMELINLTSLQSAGKLSITLKNGQKFAGTYYGSQCTRSSDHKLLCYSELGNEGPHCSGCFDVLEIASVEPWV